MKEVKEGRYTGPFKEIPFEYYIQLPIGLVPKDGGKKTRLIFHLSYDVKKSGLSSLNSYIPKDSCTVKYHDLDEAIACSFKWGGGKTKKTVYYGKTNVESAFRLVPLKRSCWMLLIFKARHPITKKIWYFVDKCLPFRASISCKIFQRFSDALKHIIEGKTQIYMAVVNYLDDFLFITYTIRECNRMMKQFLEIFFLIGVPISKAKTVWATRWITFLGFLLNEAQFYLCIPEEKCDKAVNNLNEVINKRKVTVKQIQSLAGLLNFLNRAIVLGRAFTRRMYSKYEGIVKKGDRKLKHYHHVKVDQEFKADCLM